MPWLRTHGDQISKTEIYWNKTDVCRLNINLGESYNNLLEILQKYCVESQWNDNIKKSNIFYNEWDVFYN